MTIIKVLINVIVPLLYYTYPKNAGSRSKTPAFTLKAIVNIHAAPMGRLVITRYIVITTYKIMISSLYIKL